MTDLIHTLTNGRYQVKLSNAGAGSSMQDWIALSRYAGDAVEDAHGFFIYLRDVDSDALWSAGKQPTRTEPTRYEVHAQPDKIIFKREDHEILTTMEITVDPLDDVEVRWLRVQNLSSRTRRIEITSCIEVALAHPAGDLGHPAFSKLFVQTELCGSALVAKRRPRSQGEAWPAMFHALSGSVTEAWEMDRLKFIGRGRDLRHPVMGMSGTVGNVLDPIFCLRTTLTLQAYETQEISFILGAVADHARVPELVTKHAPQASITPQSGGRGNVTSAPPSQIKAAFSEDGQEFHMTLPWHHDGLQLPPMPWCNVIANERFGCLLTERGAGSTWARNSQANRLTPWSNDPVSDPHDEALYLRDDITGKFWSPLPGPCPAPADYQVTHGFGYSRWTVTTHGLHQETTVFIAKHDPVKMTLLRITNTHHEARKLSLFSYQRLVLGTMPPAAGSIETWLDGSTLCARNPSNAAFKDGIVFSKIVGECSVNSSFDRQQFLGPLGNTRDPQALREELLANSGGGPADACFAQQKEFTLKSGQTITLGILLGEAIGADELIALRAKYSAIPAIESALDEAQKFWKESLGRLQVKTPAPEIDRMVNGWLAYQALSCRIWGRTAFYQSSGAFGFRDQLQDAGNLTLLWPELTRKQILLHAAHQFVEGDVLHWWHEPPINRGVRTRFSDDLLWLPLVTADYVSQTGDTAIWDEVIPFIKAPLLKDGEDENYLAPEPSGESASLYEHCCRAIDRSLTSGSHGLPLMGTGDWNDGMNRVGRGGRGESVWLGFFLHLILDEILPVVKQRHDERADRYADYQKKLHSALNDSGWDGAWYRRAYYDDGTPLGTSTAEECRIDGLAQAWSVLSGVASPERAEMALEAAREHLILETDGLIRLLTPPFVNTSEDPGYIRGYVAGVRENGGQYTHASCWMVRAFAKLGRRNLAAKLLLRLSPAWHNRTAAQTEIYKVEPYVVAADIYGAEPHIGRGGWTWYTGSSGWAFRAAIESVLGMRIEGGNTLVIKPCIPDDWPEYHISYQPPGSTAVYEITVVNPSQCSAAVVAVSMDDAPLPPLDGGARIPLFNTARHMVRIELGLQRSEQPD